jgi:protein gp37
MADKTKIEWADATFNPWIGCTRISGACDHCYAADLAARYGWVEWGKDRRRTSPANWKKPLQWDAKAAKTGERPRVFCLSLGDWADVEVPRQWRSDLLDLIDRCRNLDWLLLTKRHTVARKFLPATPWPHVRIGMTVEDEKAAAMRLPWLAALAHAGWPTFVSYEPALGPVDWRPWLERGAIGWFIGGGESGSEARPSHPDWFRAPRDDCAATDVPFLFKQWGAWATVYDRDRDDPDWRTCPKASGPQERYLNIAGGHGFHNERVVFVRRVGKRRAGRLLDGVEHNGFPRRAA